MTTFFRFLVLFLLFTPAYAVKESDYTIQKAYEEIADFASMRDIIWDVNHGKNWTIILRFNRNGNGEDHWIVWTVTNSSLKSAITLVEKDVYDFPEGHERK